MEKSYTSLDNQEILLYNELGQLIIPDSSANEEDNNKLQELLNNWELPQLLPSLKGKLIGIIPVCIILLVS